MYIIKLMVGMVELFVLAHERRGEMSVLNDIAKRAYELPGVATSYLANKILLESCNPIRAKREADLAEGYIDKYFTGFGSEAQFLEIGSGGGDEARYMMKRGLNVTPSDVSTRFIGEMESRGLKPILLDAINDKYPSQRYSGIFCWRVFVHFTPEDVEMALGKIYDALEHGGVAIFSVINRKARHVDSEIVDFPGIFRVYAKRYFRYYQEEQLREIIKKVPFASVECFEELEAEWLVFVLRKK